MGHILITGSSRGIGKAALAALAARGVAVIGHASRPQLAAAGAPPIIAADFGDPLSVQALWEQALDLSDGQIDAVVNNAGGIVASKSASVDGHEVTLQRNVLGSVVLTERLVPKLLNTRGRVIHTSSMVARFGRIDLDPGRGSRLSAFPSLIAMSQGVLSRLALNFFTKSRMVELTRVP